MVERERAYFDGEEFAFVITEDLLAQQYGDESDVGRGVGVMPAGADEDTEVWELYDDDGILYMRGRGYGEYYPWLYEYGLYNYGTTVLAVDGKAVIG